MNLTKKIMTISLLTTSFAFATNQLLPTMNMGNETKKENIPSVNILNETHWKSLTTSLNLAKIDDKPILVLIYSSTCPHCEKALNFLNQKDVYSNINKNFYMTKLEVNTDFIPDMFTDIKTVPAFFVINKNKQLLVPKIEGYSENKKEWLNWLDKISKQYKIYLKNH